MRLRVLDTGLAPARSNVAASAALLESVDAGAPATLRFHRYLSSCVVGRFQDVATELDLAACRAADVAIARRVTGGGAVVMGPGILAFDLVLPGGGAKLQATAERVGGALVDVLADLGLAATRPTAGSVAIGGLKMSGSAGRLARRALLHQATLILDLAGAPPLALLRRRTEGGRPTADPRHRVTDVATALLHPVIPGLAGGESLAENSQPPHPEVLGEGEPRRTHQGVACFEAGLRPAPQHEDRWSSESRDVAGSSSATRNNVAACLTRHIANALDLAPEAGQITEAEEDRTAAILAGTVGRDDFVLSGDAGRRAA